LLLFDFGRTERAWQRPKFGNRLKLPADGG